MGLFNNWQAAKKVTVALMALIRSQFPRDTLHVVGFSDYAREIKEEELASCSWNTWVSGTNLHPRPDAFPQAAVQGEGAAPGKSWSSPTASRRPISKATAPTSATLPATAPRWKPCGRCAAAPREDILINTFMLENNYQLVNFVDRMTRINRGRAFYTSATNLSEFVLVDYLNNRRKHVAA